MKTDAQKILEFIFDDKYYKPVKINNGGNATDDMFKNQWTDNDVIDEILKVKNSL